MKSYSITDFRKEIENRYGYKVSSTTIRRAIKSGKVKAKMSKIVNKYFINEIELKKFEMEDKR